MERKEGYYWVKMNGNWTVAEWAYQGNVGENFGWDTLGNQFPWEDADMDEINETRILPPDEQKPEFKVGVIVPKVNGISSTDGIILNYEDTIEDAVSKISPFYELRVEGKTIHVGKNKIPIITGITECK
jgi:hypothetical protein